MGAKLGSGGGGGAPMADINVTPLIDVVLVLLVVFMVITPMLSTGLEVDLPEATSSTTVNASDFIVISVALDGRWAVEQEVVEKGMLIDQVNFEFRKDAARETPRSLLVKADRKLPYEDVREVMDVLADAGMTAVGLAANKEK